jgi:hypothetical protein
MPRGKYRHDKCHYILTAFDLRTGKQIEKLTAYQRAELDDIRARLRARLINQRKGRYKVEIFNQTTKQWVK